MFDPERLLKQMLGGALGGAFGGSRRSRSGVVGGLGLGKAQVGLGLLGVAMAAYQHYGKASIGAAAPANPSSPAPPPRPAAALAATPPPPPAPPAAGAATTSRPLLDPGTQEAALLVRAMIAAAAADGRIDALERASILDRAREAGDDADTLAYLKFELAQPATLEELVAQTPKSLAESVYAASCLAITVDSDLERAYLDELAQGLGIPAERRTALLAQLQNA